MNNELTRTCKLACEGSVNTLFKSRRLHSMNEGLTRFTFFNNCENMKTQVKLQYISAFMMLIFGMLLCALTMAVFFIQDVLKKYNY